MTLEAHDVLKQSKLVIFDSDGCLVEEGVPYKFVDKLMDLLKQLGKQIVIFTNNSTKHPDLLLKNFETLGIKVDHVINSGKLAVEYCIRNKIESVYILGEDGLMDLFRENNISIDENQVEAVIVGMDRTLTYKRLANATRFIRNGAKFIATNPDKSFPTERGLEPGAGSMIAALEASTDKKPEIILGKPNIWGYQMLLEQFQVKETDAVMLGDRYETDILGAQRIGIPAILMQTGVMADRIKNNVTLDIGDAYQSKSMEELYINLKNSIQ
ncbi:MAG: HAD-IIA family hydrolase [Candidatus Heimdallarchaeota archaeon]|nr:HAD-IIA family hydrolase [Candidatus Heimdallarchaeota archaeon]